MTTPFSSGGEQVVLSSAAIIQQVTGDSVKGLVHVTERRIRGSNWSDDEKRVYLMLKEEALRNHRGNHWGYISENLKRGDGLCRSPESCEDLWGTLLKAFKCIRDHESNPKNNRVSYWEMDADGRARDNLPRAFSKDCFAMMKRILAAEERILAAEERVLAAAKEHRSKKNSKSGRVDMQSRVEEKVSMMDLRGEVGMKTHTIMDGLKWDRAELDKYMDKLMQKHADWKPRRVIGTNTIPQSHRAEISDVSCSAGGWPEEYQQVETCKSIQDHNNDISNSNTRRSDDEFIHALKEKMEAMTSIQIIDNEEAFSKGKCGDQSTIVLGTFNVTDDKLEFYFENGEWMAKLVGVGLLHGKAIVKRGIVFEVHEVEQNAWEKVWIEAKECSTKVYTIMQVSLPTKGLRSEQPGGNIASSSSSSKQGFPDFASAASNDASEVPCIWELAKFFIMKQVIDVFQSEGSDDVSNGSFGTNTREDSPKDGNETIMTWSQTLKGMFSKGAREANDKVGANKSSGKEEGGGGGDCGDGNGNGSDDEFPGENSKVDNIEDYFTMVNVFLLSGGVFFEKNMEPLSSRLPLSIERLDKVRITPELTFGFYKSRESKKIQVTTRALFALDRDRDDIDRSGHFGWFHDEMHVSFGPMDRNIGRNVYLKIDFKEIESISSKMSTRVSMSRDTTKGKGTDYQVGLDVGSTQGARLRLQAKTHHEESSMNHQSNEQSLESQINQTSGGFNIQALPVIDEALLEYKYFAPYFEISAEQIQDQRYRYELNRHPMCSLQKTEFVGSWIPIGSNEVVEYIFKADRRLHEISRRVKEESASTSLGFSKHFKKSNRECPQVCVYSFLEDPIIQVYEKQLYVNHAMAHLINGQTYTLVEQPANFQHSSTTAENLDQSLAPPLVTCPFPILLHY